MGWGWGGVGVRWGRVVWYGVLPQLISRHNSTHDRFSLDVSLLISAHLICLQLISSHLIRIHQPTTRWEWWAARNKVIGRRRKRFRRCLCLCVRGETVKAVGAWEFGVAPGGQAELHPSPVNPHHPHPPPLQRILPNPHLTLRVPLLRARDGVRCSLVDG